jgi:hypothetical protein
VTRIIEEVGSDESNLPLLSHALERTWQTSRSTPLLTADAYDAAGGVTQAINRAAKDCYDTLLPSQQAAARRLFLRLVRPGEGSAHVRIRAAQPDDGEERRVMQIFAHPDRRLLFLGEQAGVPNVEVAHEALVRGWDTLRGWVEDNREKLRARDAVTDYRASAGKDELIPSASTLLQRARELLADPGDVRLDRATQDYIERSIAAARAQRWRPVIFGVFAAAYAALVAMFVWFAAAGLFDQQTAAAINADTQGLAERWDEGGLAGLLATIEDRLARNVDDDAIYLLVDSQMKRIAGNLTSWPQTVTQAGARYELPVMRAGTTSMADVQRYELPGGYHLLVGRETLAREQLRSLLTSATLIVVVIAGLGTAFVAFIGRQITGFVARISRKRRIGVGDGGQTIGGIEQPSNNHAIAERTVGAESGNAKR